MKAILLILALAFLAGCNQTTQTYLTRTEYRVTNIPPSLTDCWKKTVAKPNPKTLTDRQVAKYIEGNLALIAECQKDAKAVEELQRLNQIAAAKLK